MANQFHLNDFLFRKILTDPGRSPGTSTSYMRNRTEKIIKFFREHQGEALKHLDTVTCGG